MGAPTSELAQMLVRTGDAYLLEHNSVQGRDRIWSDNWDGEGTNWLGLQLMLWRGRLSGEKHWTSWLTDLVDMETGQSLDATRAANWQNTVRLARNALMVKLEEQQPPALCARPGCGKPTWNRQPGEYCSKSCRSAQGGYPYCPTAAGNGTGGSYIGAPVALGGGGGYPTGAHNARRGGDAYYAG